MSQDRTPKHIKLDECNHVEKLLLAQFERPGWDMITLMQNLLRDKTRVTALLTRVNENDNGRGVD
jgi:hypothetical protein